MSAPLDFYTYEETLAAQATNPKPLARTLSEFEFQYITTNQELAQAIAPILGCTLLAIDTETTGLDPHRDKLRLVQVATRKHPCLVIDLWRVSDLTPLKTLLAGSARKVAHTLLFDWKWLQANELPLAGPYFDTQLAYKVLKAGVRGKSTLATVMKALLGIDLDKSAQR